MMKLTGSYFVIGTDTDVGKTYIASALVQHFVQLGLKTLGMKPIASGCEISLDSDSQPVNADIIALVNAGNVDAPLNLISPYRFFPAMAPHKRQSKLVWRWKWLSLSKHIINFVS